MINHVLHVWRHREIFKQQQQQHNNSKTCLRTHNYYVTEKGSNPGLAKGCFHYSSHHQLDLGSLSKGICTIKASEKPKKDMSKEGR